MLSSVDDGLFEVCVSEDLLNEIERVLIDTKGLAVDKAKAFTSAVASNAAHVAPNSQYLKLAAELTGPDPADLLHLAAAIEYIEKSCHGPNRTVAKLLGYEEVAGALLHGHIIP